jgi:Fe-S-cluster containining protein
VIFSDVRLQAEDNFEPFATLETLSAGTKASSNQRQLVPPSSARASFTLGKRASQVLQPCIAFDGCRCRIYSQRPKHCREFECLLLRSVRAGRTEKAAALEIIRKARCRADRVWRLLRELGDVDEERSLSARFRRTAKRLEGSQPDEHTAQLYSELTLAVHDLNCLLSSTFYPG